MAGAGGNDQDNNVSPSRIQSKQLEKLESVEVWHHEIEKEQLGRLFEHPSKGGSTIGVGLDFVSLTLEDGCQEFDHIRFVVHDVDSIHTQLQ